MVSFRHILLSGLLLASSLPAPCAPRAERRVRIREQRPVMRAEAVGDMSVNFLSLPDSPQIQGANGVGVLDLGTVSWAGTLGNHGVTIQHQSHAFVVETSLGLQIGTAGSPGQTAVLKAWLQTPVDPYHIYFDGVALSQQPVCVDAQTLVGVLTRHELKITVPLTTSAQQSKLQTEISLQVVQN